MKKNIFLICIAFSSLLLADCRSGLVTMTNGCYKSIEAGKASNAGGNYTAAVDQFNQVLKQCDAYDAKEQANAGLATAYNGLRRYNDALAAANEGLKVNKTSVDNLFQRANAELGLNMTAEAKADFAQVIDLTAKNKNTKDRATIYGKIAQIDLQQNMYSDAMNNVETAIATDNTNADFYILKGDIYAAQKNYADAMTAYDQAVTYGGNSSKIWQAKVEAETKAMQNKYGTGNNAGDLAGKMSQADKKSLCADIKQAKNYGVNNQNIDLLQLAICNK
jgi:tetratricopeptide (TPR) repeat protein